MSHYFAILIVTYTESEEFHPVYERHNVKEEKVFNAADTFKNNSKDEFHRFYLILL